MSARWIALFCIGAYFTIVGVMAIPTMLSNIQSFLLGGLQLVGGITLLLSLFIAGRSKE